MVIKSEKLHIICGVCGTRNDFKIDRVDQQDKDTLEKTYLTCKNCATLTSLEEELGLIE